jgi:hypothetical protein
LPARGDRVADDEACVRYVPPRYTDNDMIDGGAFQLRDIDKGELSVNLLGTNDAGYEAAMQQVRQLFRLTVKKSGRFAQLEVAEVRAAFTEAAQLAALDVIHDPLPAEGRHAADSSHAAIINLPSPGSEYAALAGDLLAEKIRRLHPAI